MGEGKGKRGKEKGEGQLPVKTVKLFHKAFQSTSARMNFAVRLHILQVKYPYKGDVYLHLVMLGKERSLS